MKPIDPFAVISRVISSQLAPEPSTSPPSCFTALGDSFTAGTGCRAGEAWADRLAGAIVADRSELAYFNLAVDGATSAEVLEQLPLAIELEPDLVTVICGANDALRTTRPDAVAYAENLGSIFRRLRGAGAGVRIATATAPEGWDFLSLGPRTRDRVKRGIEEINDATRAVADRHGIPYLEVAGHSGLSEEANFADDGLHPSPLGHARAAHAFAALLRERYGIETELEEVEA